MFSHFLEIDGNCPIQVIAAACSCSDEEIPIRRMVGYVGEMISKEFALFLKEKNDQSGNDVAK